MSYKIIDVLGTTGDMKFGGSIKVTFVALYRGSYLLIGLPFKKTKVISKFYEKLIIETTLVPPSENSIGSLEFFR